MPKRSIEDLYKLEYDLLRFIIEGEYSEVQRVLNAGANPNTANELGWTALEIAKRYHHEQIITLLRKKGAT
jgi:ankyrin repeat protein